VGIQGWQIALSSSTYRTPNTCSSCLGPREVEVEAEVSEKHGNIRTTLKMSFPYCTPCAGRAKREKTRTALVLVGAAVLGVLFCLGACFVASDGVLEAVLGFGFAILVAAGHSAALSFATRPAIPPAPATARGEAVILRDTSGTVLCTNQRFAEMLAQANGATPRPGSITMTTEAWAPITALLLSVLVVACWGRYGPPMRSSPPPRPAAVSSPSPKKPTAPASTRATPPRTR
jgi:hypothetical protein